ncbi:MAG: alpha/beta fold hydrolase [Gemmatimonadota bacterium]
MATPTLTQHSLPGALGPILIDVRAATRTTPQPAVLIMHGFKGFKDYAFLPPMAERLARAGFTAVNISVSGAGVDGHGQFTMPERFARNTYSRELGDVAIAIRALMAGELGTAPPSSLGMIGHSRGGGVAICVTNETRAISALVTWAPISTIDRFPKATIDLWRKNGRIEVENVRTRQKLPMDYEIVEDAIANASRFDILAAAEALDRPWLLVHGTDDETVPLAEGRRLSAAATDLRFEQRFIEGGTHTFGASHPWTGHTKETEQLFRSTVDFLSRHLR